MKRRNVQMAFVGEGLQSGDEDVENLVEGDEAVDVEVTGGKLMVTVPAGTPDEQIFEGARTLGGELLLENGTRLSFQIEADAVGAQFGLTRSSDEPEVEQGGPSSLPDVPGGA